MSGQKTLDAPFFAKMGRLLALWRLRRAVSAVRVLLFLNSKMRRLRALWKFRRSSSIASMIGSSWVRRAREIRFGAAIERLQACNHICMNEGCNTTGDEGCNYMHMHMQHACNMHMHMTCTCTCDMHMHM